MIQNPFKILLPLLLLASSIAGAVPCEASDGAPEDLIELVTWKEALATTTPTPQKQRILVFTDPGGGGHLAASRAVESTLGELYEIKVITPLSNIPFVSSYNTNQKNGSMRALQFMAKMQPLAEFLAKRFKTRKIITQEILNFKPDLIISVIPVVNQLTRFILEENGINIPFLILTTDLEVSHFFVGMNQPGPTVKVSLSFDDENLRAPLRDRFTDENFIALGFPLRNEFGISSEERQPKVNEIREELDIINNDKTVLIMMGAQGTGRSILKYTKSILKSHLGDNNSKIHVVALCGGNQRLKHKTEKLSNRYRKKNPNVVVHALSLKPGDYIAALMNLANVLVSKPGGASVNEAFASELYTLYHTDRSFWHPSHDILLPWEAGNMKYSIEKKWGEKIRRKKDFIPQLEEALKRPRLAIEECQGRTFKHNLMIYVQQLLENSAHPETELENPLEVNSDAAVLNKRDDR